MQISRRTRRSTAHALMTALEPRQLFAAVPTGFVDTLLGNTQLTSGTAFDFSPDGRVFVLQQTGAVRIYDINGVNSTLLSTPALTLTVDSSGERGLLGLAFDPNFASNNYIYLYHTVPANGSVGVHNRVSRFTVSGNTINAASATALLDLDPLSTATNHNGGAIHFGSDGKLYVAVGDNANGSNSQSVTNRLGKILRINSDGSIPADNPTSFKVRPNAGSTAFTTVTPTGVNRAIWALGFRNPYTFSADRITGQILINDVGEGTWEEINVLGSGKNYGWPRTEGDFSTSTAGNEEFARPLYSYQHSGGAFPYGFAISGGAQYGNLNASLQFPSTYQGKYFFGDYVNDWIGYIDPANPPANPNGATQFATKAYGIVDLKVRFDGSLFYLGRDQNGGDAGVHRIEVDRALAPDVTVRPTDQTVNQTESATFTATATGANLTYQWTRNGVDIPGATSSTFTITNAQLVDNGAMYRVRVSNIYGIALSNVITLTVISNTQPPQIVGKVFNRDDPLHRITITFDKSVQPLSASTSASIVNRTTSTTVTGLSLTLDASRKVLTVTPSQRFSDGRFRLTLSGFTDTFGNALAMPTYDFLFMLGDATGDGVVNFDDLVPLAMTYNFTGRLYREGDFDYSGNVNFDDLVILSQRYNTSLPDAPLLVAKTDNVKAIAKTKTRAIDGLV